MKLIFHDRSGYPATLSGEALLTVERGGNFSLSVAAVEALKLSPESQALLAEDVDTNTWYLLFGKVAGQQTFTLHPRDRKGKALQFCCLPKARAYFEAHGIDKATTRSVRATVSLEPLRHEKLVLYPLVPRHATTMPALASAEAAPVQEHAAAADAPAVDEVAATPAAPANETTNERMERLTDYWFEREIKQCPDAELTELVSLLADKPKKERDIVENQLLNRGKTEIERRKKIGGNRG